MTIKPLHFIGPVVLAALVGCAPAAPTERPRVAAACSLRNGYVWPEALEARDYFAPRSVTKKIGGEVLLDINVAYPLFDGAKLPGADLVNATIQRELEKVISSYMAPEEEGLKEERYLTAEFKVTLLTPALVSLHFDFETFANLGAHPSHFTTALTIETGSGKVLSLVDLFKNDPNLLSKISAFSIGKLKQIEGLDERDISEGASPRAENFSRWNLTPTGVLIHFDEYQVAAYVHGRQNVEVPYALLSGLIDPSGPLASLCVREPRRPSSV